MSQSWIEPREFPPLKNGEVHVWLANIPDVRPRLAEFQATLSSDETERASRFRFPEHRERSQISRGILRSLLGQYLAANPRELSFTYNAHGKPGLNDGDLRFNTSHAGDYVVLAFTEAANIGIDIERVRPDMARTEEIARRHFAPGEQAQLNALSEAERLRAFFDLWTCKEAFVKARGGGLFSGLDQFEVLLAEARVLSVCGVAVSDWWMSALPEVKDYAGAVAVNVPVCRPLFWRWK
jgi:4'-phosphopantetheinyl transferase